MKNKNQMIRFKATFLLLIIAALVIPLQYTFAQTANVDDSLMIRAIFDEALINGECDPNLRYLTSKIGARMSGSPNAQKAVEWAKATMEKIGADRVYLQDVMVPHWVRGAREKASFTVRGGKTVAMDVCALGGSVATGGVLTTQVIEVRSWAALDSLKAEDVKGKFIFFNRAMDPREIETFKAYLDAADQRGKGAVEAARKGAAGALVRSLTWAQQDVPHTGAMAYDKNVKKIPAAALSTNSADKLSIALMKHPGLSFSLQMNCMQLPDVLSHNVIAEIRGTTHPEEIVTVGGHIDTWDLSEGASDDGTGFVQTMEVLRLINTSGKRPERTFRAILYMNEEAGAHGAIKYAEIARTAGENHVAVIESDAGGFTPRGFRIESTPEISAKIKAWNTLFVPYKVSDIQPNQRGVDLVPMKGMAKALISLDCDDQRLFGIHHSVLDTYDKVNSREVELGAASMAALVMLISKYGL